MLKKTILICMINIYTISFSKTAIAWLPCNDCDCYTDPKEIHCDHTFSAAMRYGTDDCTNWCKSSKSSCAPYIKQGYTVSGSCDDGVSKSI